MKKPFACLALLLATACSGPTDKVTAFDSLSSALAETSCSDAAPCSGTLVCVEDAAGPGENRCERAHALYSFLEMDREGVALAFEQVSGTWRTERARTVLTSVPYSMQLGSGEQVVCRDSEEGPTRDCYVPDWRAYVDPSAITNKYDRFALFGLRPLRFLVEAWRHESDAQLSAIASARGSSLSPATIRLNMRNTYLAALDSFTTTSALAFALPSDPAPSTSAGWLNPNGAIHPGMALWDPAANVNCKTEKTVRVPGFPALTYYDLRSSLWDRHASAFRALSILNAYFHARGLLSSAQAERWLGVLRGLADSLALSGSFEADANHGITESAALLQLSQEFDGVSAPRLSDTAGLIGAWKELARQRLNDVVSDTIQADGAQIEQSLFYHNYELSFLVEIKDWISRNPGADLAAVDSSRYDYATCGDGTVFDDHIEPNPNLDLASVVDAAARVSTHTVMPSAEVPMLGSSPTSNLSTFWQSPFDAYVESDTRDVVQQFQFVRSQGTSGLPIPLSQRMQIFPSAGYVTLRSAFAPSYGAQTHLLFNTAVPTNIHSHLDTLSVHLYAQNPATASPNDGLPLLVDSGWYSYAVAQRHYFESTAAHNTVTVDGLNQCSFDPTGKRQNPTLTAPPLTNCAAIADGYPARRSRIGGSLFDTTGQERVLYQSAEASLYAGVRHRRGVALIGRDLVLVLDRLSAQIPHSYQQNWHFGSAVANVVPAPLTETTAHFSFLDEAGRPLFSGHFSDGSAGSFVPVRGTCGTCAGNFCAGNACAEPRQGWLSAVENSKHPGWVLLRQAPVVSEVAWASAFLLGDLAARSAKVQLSALAAQDSYRMDVTLEDGMSVSLQTDALATSTEAAAISYPLRGAFASYSFESDPDSAQDLAEGLAISVSVPGETTDNVVSRAGVVGSAYEYISGGTKLGSSNSFGFMHKPGAKFSLSFWLRMSSANLGFTGGTQGIFSTSNWSNAGTGIQVYFQDDASKNNSLRFVIRGGGTSQLSFSSPALFIPEDTSWHHYVLVFDSSAAADQIRVYRDGGNRVVGKFVGSLSSEPNDAAATIGKKPGAGVAFPLRATLDELVAFRRPLSDADARALYNDGAGLRAH
jgi:hypothetical protein